MNSKIIYCALHTGCLPVSVLLLVHRNSSEWALLLTLLSLCLIVTVTCRNTPGLTELTPTDRQTARPAPGHRTPLHAARPSTADQTRSIDTGIDRLTAMSAAVDQNRRVACGEIRGTGAAKDDISVWNSWSSPRELIDHLFIRFIDHLIATLIRGWEHNWSVWSPDRFQTEQHAPAHAHQYLTLIDYWLSPVCFHLKIWIYH